MTEDGTDQIGLSSWSATEIVETTRAGRNVACPDCGEQVGHTKGGQQLPEEIDAKRTFGWRCSSCNNIMPCRAFNPQADTFNDNYRGLEVEFRGGHRRFIPVPARYVDSETNQTEDQS